MLAGKNDFGIVMKKVFLIVVIVGLVAFIALQFHCIGFSGIHNHISVNYGIPFTVFSEERYCNWNKSVLRAKVGKLVLYKWHILVIAGNFMLFAVVVIAPYFLTTYLLSNKSLKTGQEKSKRTGKVA